MNAKGGFISFEIIIALSIFLIILTFCTPKLISLHKQLYVDYVTHCLASNLRIAQQQNAILPPNGGSKGLVPAKLCIYPHKAELYTTDKKVHRLELPKEITLSCNRGAVISFNFGNPMTYSSATIYIKGGTYWRMIHITSYGRIRI